MEHEDNAQFDNYLQSAQQQNLQLGNNTTGNGDALVGLGLGLNVDANMVGCGGAIGEVGKFDDVEDENELKYIKEVNQSEKEQAAVGNGRNHQDAMHDDVDDDDDDEDDYDNEGMPSMQYRNNGNDEHHNGATKDDFDALHNDVGDFSQTSNTASTADGGCVDMLQVEMKIEPLQQQQQQQQHAFDEEDPSSNGTSSLSENAPMPQQLASTFDFLSDNADLLQQNKENTDPDKLSASPVPRPTELNFEVHGSHLNPDAKEFVPSCGSNATSPTMSETADVEHVGEPVEQPLSALPRHRLLSGDDDVVARSPRKGREMNMDADNLVLPDSELDFDNEAQKRPHEFEQDEDLLGSNCVEIAQSPTNEVEVEAEPEPQPEIEPELNDVMKQSIYLAENGDIQQHEALENVLNSVQPLPTDIESLNSSFTEDVYAGTPEEMRAIDLLGHEIGVDEEHTSHPPSIEEMQMNLQNVKNKDEANNMNLDMNSAAHMQESFYMEKHEQEQEQTINDNKEQQQEQQEEPEEQQEEEKEHNDDGFYAQQFAANESLLMDTSIPAFSAEHNQSIDKQFINNDDFSGNAKVLDYDEQNIVTNMSSPSPKSTVEEKHLMEETKEQLVAKTIQDGQQFVEELGKKMENLLSTGIDCDLKQESATVTQIEEPTQFQNDAFEQQQFEEIVNEHENELLPKTEQQPTEKIEQVEAASEIAPTAATIDVESAEIAAAAAVVATTAVAAAAVTAAQTDKKAETTTKKPAVKPAAAAKSSTSTTAKKPITKTTTSTTASAAAARPRTAPAKVASSTVSKTSVASSTAAKKPTTGTTAAASKTSLPAKPLASKPSTTSRVSLTAKSSTSTTTTTARKPLTTAASSTSTAASAAKTARPASAQPTKSTMSVTAAKPKISPRATLTSQLRNKVSPAAPANATSTTKATTVKSPTKPSAGSDATASKVASATRVKSATSTTAAGTTSTTKLFTARPAPKTTTTSSVRSVTARTVSKTSPLKTSPRAVASTLKAKAATTKDATKSPAKDTRKTPTKVGGKDAENKQKENVVAQMNGVEEKVGNENIQLQNGSVEVEKVTPLEIDGQV